MKSIVCKPMLQKDSMPRATPTKVLDKTKSLITHYATLSNKTGAPGRLAVKIGYWVVKINPKRGQSFK